MSKLQWLFLKGFPNDNAVQVVVLERGEYRGKAATKLLLAPVTGRRHQLRSAGCGIVLVCCVLQFGPMMYINILILPLTDL